MGSLNINFEQAVSYEQITLAHQDSIFRKDIIDIGQSVIVCRKYITI